MKFSQFLCCPVCGAPLSQEGGSLFCAGRAGKRHCYDIAAAGYVNLLPPGRQGNAHTGDDGGMLAARARFLDGGFYDGISDAAADLCAQHLSRPYQTIRFCDAGAGEGYHTCRIAGRLGAVCGSAVDGCGIDASKKGAARGARRARTLPEETNVCFAAGNIFSLPVSDGSLDAFFSLFAPIPAAEAHRTLHRDGVLIVAASAPRHLWEMRSLLYQEVRPNDTPVRTPEGFSLLEKREYRTQVFLPDQQTLDALFAMTPFYYRSPPEGRARLAAAGAMTVSVEADLYAYRRMSGSRETALPEKDGSE